MTMLGRHCRAGALPGAAAFWPTGNVSRTPTPATADTDTRWIIAGMVAPRAASLRALIVEDEASIREIVRLHLSLAGFETEEVADGRAALDRLRTDRFDLVVLDVMLPGIDGVTICRAMRSGGPNQRAGVLMLTARDTEPDKVIGLESGADDYLTKPFGVRELMARVTAIVRRSSGALSEAARTETGIVTSADVTLDPDRRQARVRGELVETTKQEFDLLYLLASRRGIVFSRAALIAKVWGDDTYVTERTVDSVVSRLRRKVERDPDDPEMILTAWGVGYKFVDAGEASDPS
jgi:DNA-binding response OmpR family regulator